MTRSSISPTAISEALLYRQACKAFDPDKKIADKDIQLILEAIRLSPSSYGIEPFNVIVAQDAQLRHDLKKHAAMNGSRFTASHFLIFTAKTSRAMDDYVTYMLRDSKQMNTVKATAYKAFWKHWAKKDFHLFDTPEALHQWAARQAYIALGIAMMVAAERQIDSCPIEGFALDETAETLTRYQLIDPHADRPVVMLALGYRTAHTKNPAQKQRRPLDEVVHWY